MSAAETRSGLALFLRKVFAGVLTAVFIAILALFYNWATEGNLVALLGGVNQIHFDDLSTRTGVLEKDMSTLKNEKEAIKEQTRISKKLTKTLEREAKAFARELAIFKTTLSLETEQIIFCRVSCNRDQASKMDQVVRIGTDGLGVTDIKRKRVGSTVMMVVHEIERNTFRVGDKERIPDIQVIQKSPDRPDIFSVTFQGPKGTEVGKAVVKFLLLIGSDAELEVETDGSP